MSYAPVKLAAEILAKKSGELPALYGGDGFDGNSSVEAVVGKRDVINRGRCSNKILVKKVERCQKSASAKKNLLSKKKIKIAHVTKGLTGGKITQITHKKAEEIDFQSHSVRRSARLITRLEHT